MKIKVCLAFLILLFAACAASETDTPTAAFRKYIEAAGKKDSALVKENASRGSQKLVEEAIKNQIGKVENPETRDEQIGGETATLEYKNAATGTWDKVFFVREDGRWKLALDKSMEEVLNSKQPK